MRAPAQLSFTRTPWAPRANHRWLVIWDWPIHLNGVELVGVLPGSAGGWEFQAVDLGWCTPARGTSTNPSYSGQIGDEQNLIRSNHGLAGVADDGEVGRVCEVGVAPFRSQGSPR